MHIVGNPTTVGGIAPAEVGACAHVRSAKVVVALGLGIADDDFIEDAGVGHYVGLLCRYPDLHLAVAAVGTIEIRYERYAARAYDAQTGQQVGMLGFHAECCSLGDKGFCE